MRILFLNHPECDWQEMGMFDGFCRLLGDENVVTYPYKPSYYGLVDTAYKLPDGSYGVTQPPPQIRARQQGPWTRTKILDHIETFNLVYISSHRRLAVEAARELWPWIKDKPIVLTDTEDHEWFDDGLAQEFTPKVCFKRCLTPALKDRYPWLHPLLMAACIPDHADWWDDISDHPDDKALHVSARLGNTHAVREKLIFALEKFAEKHPPKWMYRLSLSGRSFFGQYSGDSYGLSSLPYHVYLQEMATAYATIVTRGWGLEALRMCEANMFATCVFWIRNPNLIYPHPYPEDSVVYLDEDLNGLEDRLEYYLKNLDEALKIGQRGKEHLYKYHTSDKRAASVIRLAGLES